MTSKSEAVTAVATGITPDKISINIQTALLYFIHFCSTQTQLTVLMQVSMMTVKQTIHKTISHNMYIQSLLSAQPGAHNEKERTILNIV